MDKKKLEIQWTEFSQAEWSNSEWKPLVEASKMALNQAWAPYSAFRVGCALQLRNGQIVTGSNQENAAYPSGICAERTAIFYAGHLHPHEPIQKLVVTTEKLPDSSDFPACPCGACLQVMSEQQNRQPLLEYEILLVSPQGVAWKFDTINALLPFRFNLTPTRP